MPAADFPIADLLAWYARHQRDLPFRPHAKRKANPYHVLVSEVMAQQTQIATVVTYFHRFVAAFPTAEALAEADEQQVLTLWQGLGYYRRARSLHAAAKMIVENHAGQVPATVKELLGLPGVGRYTAGAIASVAYNVAAPIVDGNVARVYARYFGIEDAVDQPAGQKKLWQLATTLVESTPPKPATAKLPRGSAPPGNKASQNTAPGSTLARNTVTENASLTSTSPRDFNQAVMELGALVCTPKSAKCGGCPLRPSCRAHATNRVEALPVKTPKKKPLEVTHTVLAVERRGKHLFEQRSGSGLWANMWQLPTLEDALPTLPATRTPRSQRGANTAAKRGKNKLQAYLRDRFNLGVTAPKLVTHFIHQTTHRTIRFEVMRCSVTAGRLPAGSGQWRTLRNLDDLPLAKPQLVAIEHLL